MQSLFTPTEMSSLPFSKTVTTNGVESFRLINVSPYYLKISGDEGHVITIVPP